LIIQNPQRFVEKGKGRKDRSSLRGRENRAGNYLENETEEHRKMKIDGPVKSPSVPLGAGLGFNFVVAVPEELTPSGASLLSFCAPCPACGGRAFYETIDWATFYEFIKIAYPKMKIFAGIIP
jgi:hypothetical protein